MQKRIQPKRLPDARAWLAALLVLLLCLGMLPASAESNPNQEELSGSLASDLGGEISGVSGGSYQAFNDSMLVADLLVGYCAQPSSILNPYFNNENDFISLNQIVFESLVTLDDAQKPMPQLADTWEHEENVWTYHLRSDVYFHDGTRMTADDVVASYNQCLLQPELNPYATRLIRLVESIIAVDDNTIIVNSLYPGIMTLYAMDFPVVQASTVSYDLPNGTGPFKYVSYQAGFAIRLEASEYWWKKAPDIRTITFIYYKDTADAIEALQTQQIDMFATRSMNASLSRKLNNVTSMDFGSSIYDLLLPNLNQSMLTSDRSLRTAIMYGIDRTELVTRVYRDMAIQSEVPILPGTWLYESQSTVYYYSPERSLQLLYDAGWKDMTGNLILDKLNGIQLVELRLNLITYNDSTNTVRENAAKLIAEDLRKVGIRVDVEVVSQARCKSRIKSGDYDLALVSYNLSELPRLAPLFARGGVLNLNYYENESVTEALNKILEITDEEELKQVFSDIQMMVVEDLPIMGLLFRAGSVLANRRLDSLAGLRAMDMYKGIEYLPLK